MQLVLSRHAERRSETYGIKYEDILRLVEKALETEQDRDKLISKVEQIPSGFRKYPLRVIFRFSSSDKIILISVHPLRKGKKK